MEGDNLMQNDNAVYEKAKAEFIQQMKVYMGQLQEGVYPKHFAIGCQSKPCARPDFCMYNSDGRCGDRFCTTTAKPNWLLEWEWKDDEIKEMFRRKTNWSQK